MKDKSITQSVPDIKRRLQWQVLAPNNTMEELLKVVISVFYSWDQEEAKEKN